MQVSEGDELAARTEYFACGIEKGRLQFVRERCPRQAADDRVDLLDVVLATESGRIGHAPLADGHPRETGGHLAGELGVEFNGQESRGLSNTFHQYLGNGTGPGAVFDENRRLFPVDAVGHGSGQHRRTRCHRTDRLGMPDKPAEKLPVLTQPHVGPILLHQRADAPTTPRPASSLGNRSCV